MKNRINLLAILFLFSVQLVSAQDTIYKRTKEVINAKIIEIGLDEIKYKVPGYEQGPTIVIAKDQIWKIVFATGLTQILQPEMFNPETYASQRKSAIKTDFIAPMLNHFTFVYERSIRPGASWEASLGIIGLGYKPNGYSDHASGAFIKAGYKFIHSPDYYVRGMKYAHILKGGYIRPELTFGSYSEDLDYYEYPNGFYYPYVAPQHIIERNRLTYGGLTLNFGKQWVMDDIFLVDMFAGAGYCFVNNSSKHENQVDYGIIASAGSPFAVSGGLRIGFLTK